MNILALYKHTKAHTPSLGFLADSMFALTFLYFSLCHPEKHWLFNKNNLPSFPILCPFHPFFFLSHVFKGCLSQIQNNSSYAPTTSKAHFKIENSYKHLYFWPSTFLRQSLPPFTLNYCHSKNTPTILNQTVQMCTGFIRCSCSPSHHKNSHCSLNILFIWRNIIVKAVFS